MHIDIYRIWVFQCCCVISLMKWLYIWIAYLALPLDSITIAAIVFFPLVELKPTVFDKHRLRKWNVFYFSCWFCLRGEWYHSWIVNQVSVYSLKQGILITDLQTHETNGHESCSGTSTMYLNDNFWLRKSEDVFISYKHFFWGTSFYAQWP